MSDRLREALKLAVSHIEHMAAWIGEQRRGYSFESLGEDMPGIKAALRASTDAAPVADWIGPVPCDGRKPDWLPDNALCMIAYNPLESQNAMTWEFAEKRAKPARDRDWDGATAFCFKPLAHPPADAAAVAGEGLACGDENAPLCPACSLPAHELTQVPGCGAPMTKPLLAITAEELGVIMQEEWSEICEDAKAHPLDIRREGRKLFYDPRHWTAAIADRLNARAAAHPPATDTAQAEPIKRIEDGHADTEGEAIARFEHLNCPTCGGSGHIGDAQAEPDDLTAVYLAGRKSMADEMRAAEPVGLRDSGDIKRILKATELWRDMDGVGTLETYGLGEREFDKLAAALSTPPARTDEMRQLIDAAKAILADIADHPNAQRHLSGTKIMALGDAIAALSANSARTDEGEG